MILSNKKKKKKRKKKVRKVQETKDGKQANQIESNQQIKSNLNKYKKKNLKKTSNILF